MDQLLLWAAFVATSVKDHRASRWYGQAGGMVKPNVRGAFVAANVRDHRTSRRYEVQFPRMANRIRRLFLFHIFVVGLIAATSNTTFSQQPQLKSITYRLSMSKPVSHLFEVSIEVELADQPTSTSLDFQMAKWSPGRYAVFDFAKNIQQVHAASGICPRQEDQANTVTPTVCRPSPLLVTRLDNQTWRVDTRGNSAVTFNYRVFANDLSGTFSQLDARHANFNGPSVFMYIANQKAHPVRLVIYPPTNWRIVNGRTDRATQREWHFPNWDIMADTPTEIAPDWTLDSFTVDSKTYHMMVHSFGDEGGKRSALVRDIEKIVRAQLAMWGPPELESYTFLLHFAADDRSGDGMEHLTSTQIIEPGALEEPDTYQSALGTVSHEFFHIWNVKRLRPRELGPWDFSRPVNTRLLWVAEGFTNYYGHLMMMRSGLWTPAEFLRRESRTITEIENAPGNRLMSAEESSLVASFIDGAPHEQRNNLINTSISYYPKGELIGIVLDLMIRGRTEGRASLDDVMRRMYQEFYLNSPNDSYYLRGRSYTTEDLVRVSSDVAGFDLTNFFNRHARGVEVLPYDEAFGYVGLRVVREALSDPINAGITLKWQSTDAVVGAVRHNSPAEDAGLQQDDELISIGGRKVTRENWLRFLARYKTGDRVPITFKRDRKTMQTNVLLSAPERFVFRIEEQRDATELQKKLRDQWLR